MALSLSKLIDEAVEQNIIILYLDKPFVTEKGTKYWDISFSNPDKIIWQGENSFEAYLKKFINCQETIKKKSAFDNEYYLDRASDLLLIKTIIHEMIRYGRKYIDLNWAINRLAKIHLDEQAVKMKRSQEADELFGTLKYSAFLVAIALLICIFILL